MKQTPLIMAHGRGSAHGPDNSTELIRELSKYSFDMMELDVQKSKDGVLYCFHGSIPFGVIGSFFLKLFKFSTIQKLLGAEELSTLLDVLDDDKIVYCDIKDKRINAEDLKKVFQDRHFREIWIAPYSFSYLEELIPELGSDFKYIHNRGTFFFESALKKASEIGVHYLQLFYWQCTDEHIQKVKEVGLGYTICNFGISAERYEKLALEKGSALVCYDDFDSIIDRNKKIKPPPDTLLLK